MVVNLFLKHVIGLAFDDQKPAIGVSEALKKCRTSSRVNLVDLSTHECKDKRQILPFVFAEQHTCFHTLRRISVSFHIAREL